MGASFCVGVGYYREDSGAERTLIEENDGREWFVVRSPDTTYGKDKLASVSCSSPTFCVAVGWVNVFESGFTKLIEVWNGTSWTIVNRQPEVFAKLESVQCLRATWCVAVGYVETSSSVPRTLVEQWDGARWIVVHSPNERGADVMFNDLHGVACVSATSCLAVGDFELLDNEQRTETEIWNGEVWSMTPSPDPGAVEDSLNAVACPQRHLCFGVGSASSDSSSSLTHHSLIEEWNGAHWTRDSVPSPSLVNDVLSGISCVGRSFCSAVGVQHQDLGGEPIVDEWNTGKWRDVTSPTPTLIKDAPLSGVTCVDSSECFAVGSYVNENGATLSLIEHWNGTAWSTVSAPNHLG